MKNGLRLASIAVLFSIAYSCNDNGKVDVAYIDDKNIENKQIELHELDLDIQPMVLVSLCFVDSFMIVCEDDNKLKTDFISVYNESKLLKKFGQLGSGPADMVTPMYLSEGKCEKQYLAVSSASSIMKFDIEYLISNDSLVCLNEDVPEKIRLCNALLYDSDTLAICNCTGENQITFYDKRNGEMKGYSFFDEDFFSNEKITNFICNMQVFPSVCGSNGHNILVAYTMQKSLDIVSANGNLVKRIHFNDYDHNRNKFRMVDSGNLTNVIYDENVTYYFCSSCVTDEAFYAICQEEYSQSEPRSIVYKFDWDGNLLLKYCLNRVIRTAVVHDGVIYSISQTADGEYGVCCGEL